MKQLSKIIALFFLFSSTLLLAQNGDSTVVLYGQVLEDKTGEPIYNAHIVNKDTYIGTVSNESGYFYINCKIGDSLVVSSLGYDYYYYLVEYQPKEVIRVRMIEKIYYLNQVTLANYKLTSNDPKAMKMGKPMIPKDSEIKYPNPTSATLANPIDLLYEMFSNRSKQLAALRELQAKDAYKEKLKNGNNREILSNLTGLSKYELEEFLFYCKYSQVQISTMNDYTLLMTLMQCYEEYLRVKERERILSEYENGDTIVGERFK